MTDGGAVAQGGYGIDGTLLQGAPSLRHTQWPKARAAMYLSISLRSLMALPGAGGILSSTTTGRSLRSDIGISARTGSAILSSEDHAKLSEFQPARRPEQVTTKVGEWADCADSD